MRYRIAGRRLPVLRRRPALFGLQMVFGLLAAAKYLGPDPLL